MPDTRPIDQVDADEKTVAAAIDAITGIGRKLAELRNLLRRHFPEAADVELILGSSDISVEFFVPGDDQRQAVINRLIANPCHGLPSFDVVDFDSPPHVTARIAKDQPR